MQGRDIGLRLSKLLRYHVAYGPLSPDVLLRAPPRRRRKGCGKCRSHVAQAFFARLSWRGRRQGTQDRKKLVLPAWLK